MQFYPTRGNRSSYVASYFVAHTHESWCGGRLVRNAINSSLQSNDFKRSHFFINNISFIRSLFNVHYNERHWRTSVSRSRSRFINTRNNTEHSFSEINWLYLQLIELVEVLSLDDLWMLSTFVRRFISKPCSTATNFNLA